VTKVPAKDSAVLDDNPPLRKKTLQERDQMPAAKSVLKREMVATLTQVDTDEVPALFCRRMIVPSPMAASASTTYGLNS
jgi:hypothetical protein